MAIVFTKDIAQDKLLMAYNNNVIKFYSSSTTTPLKATISGFGINAVLYPHPNGSFMFNLKDYIIAVINTKNFVDDLVTDIDPLDIETFHYDVTNGCYKQDTLQITIEFIDATTESASRELHFITGVENLESYKRNEILFVSNPLSILSPVEDRANNTAKLFYFDGYPFEFSFYITTPNIPLKFINTTNGLDATITPTAKVNSLFISDGDTSISLEDFLPLVAGTNKILFELDDEPQDLNLFIDKKEASCGVYIKFLNQYGRWNYWLFSDKHFRNRTTKSGSEINNDFNNLEDTISPTLITSKTSTDSLKIAYERIPKEDKIILDSISESIKILMFTGERFSKSNPNDWMEVQLKTQSFQLYDHNKELYNFYFDLQLPDRYTLTL
ncbi:hypothetical protein [Flavobacterium sp.]|uniref:hypothetical protein n=1 Tax=Flavobacterium sp. TaxID=239 RepID=UPI00261DFF31|nr:hypothetical protein [Flavobacterium sp.]